MHFRHGVSRKRFRIVESFTFVAEEIDDSFKSGLTHQILNLKPAQKIATIPAATDEIIGTTFDLFLDL